MSGLERLLAEIAAASLLIGCLILYERHAGAAQCIQAVKIETAHEEGRQQAQAHDDTQSINIEAAALAKAHTPDPDAIPAPIVRVCKYPGSTAVPRAASASPVPDAAQPLRGADPLPGPDIGPELVQVGRVADAYVAQLHDYVERVCRAK